MGLWILKAGLILAGIGILVVFSEKLGIHPGRLPGDIRMVGRHGSFYFPFVTCILLSLVLSLAAFLFRL